LSKYPSAAKPQPKLISHRFRRFTQIFDHEDNAEISIESVVGRCSRAVSGIAIPAIPLFCGGNTIREGTFAIQLLDGAGWSTVIVMKVEENAEKYRKNGKNGVNLVIFVEISKKSLKLPEKQ